MVLVHRAARGLPACRRAPRLPQTPGTKEGPAGARRPRPAGTPAMRSCGFPAEGGTERAGLAERGGLGWGGESGGSCPLPRSSLSVTHPCREVDELHCPGGSLKSSDSEPLLPAKPWLWLHFGKPPTSCH